MEVGAAVEIDAPRPLVARLSGHPAGMVRWQRRVSAYRWRGAHGMAVGRRFELISWFLGREMSRTYRVAEFVPDAWLVLVGEAGATVDTITYRWHDVDSTRGPRTRCEVRVRTGAAPMATLGARSTGWGLRRALKKDLAMLRIVVARELRRSGA